MTVPVRWDTLQLHHGSPENSFELLCALLAACDERCRNRSDMHFVRNGRPDGGAEGYWEGPKGALYGYQAKYFTKLGSSQWSQLDESVRKALAAYPTLARLTVCLPLDLPNSPRAGRSTGRDLWKKKCAEWVAIARKTREHFDIDLWDSTEITRQLSLPANANLRQFFFNPKARTPQDTVNHVHQQIGRVGPRYQPQLHVAHDLEPLFDWLTMSEPHRRAIVAGLEKAKSLLAHNELSVLVPSGKSADEHFALARNAIHSLTAALKHSPVGLVEKFALGVDDALYEAVFSRLHAHNPRANEANQRLPEREQYALQRRWECLTKVTSAISEHLEVLGGDQGKWRLQPACDSRFIVIAGSGGCGKTHLLCEMAGRIAKRDDPVILLLGQALNARNFGNQPQFDGQSSLSDILAWLNTAGAINGCRGLLMIDALNEAEEPGYWESELRALSAALVQYPHVAIVASIRDSYAEHVLPSREDCPAILRIEHDGFEQCSGAALDHYCRHYNIALPDVPVLNPEFDNPLFLSMFCQTLAGEPDPEHKRSATPFPGGHVGFGKVFDDFLQLKERRIIQELALDLDGSRAPLRDAIKALATRAAASPTLDVPLDAARTIVSKHLRPASGAGNLVTRLESEGLLLRVPRWKTDKRVDETVRFAYDRMGAHFVVSAWLEPAKKPKDALRLFGRDGVFAKLANNERQYSLLASVCEELILQWPERYRVEIFDSRPRFASIDFWLDLFLRALRVSSPASWTPSTPEWLQLTLNKSTDRQEDRARIVFGLLTRIGHSALSRELHKYLEKETLGERDAWWTIWISAGRFSERDSSLVSWPLEHGTLRLSETEATNYGTALAWLTTSTNRLLRATATKSFSAVIGVALTASSNLLRRFRRVNDPYVLQAVCLGIYGACMRSTDAAAARSIAETVQALWPKKRSWPVDIVTRHALAGIVELAASRNPGWHVDVNNVAPPYRSMWRTNVLGWDEIERCAKKDADRKLYGFSTIYRSCIPEHYRGKICMYGDFGRYVVDSAVYPFLPYVHDPKKRPKRPFDHDLPHRFIITRVLELGWTSKRFNEFDRGCGSGDARGSVIERIGKKYQWIALAEFLARASDRFPIEHTSWPEHQFGGYQYPHELHQYFFADTSLIQTQRSNGEHLAGRKAFPPKPTESFWTEPDDSQWLLSAHDFPDPATLLIQKALDGSPQAIVLRAYSRWNQDAPDQKAERDRKYRTVTIGVTALAVRPDDLVHLDRWMRTNRAHNVPIPPPYREVLFGELYWSRSTRWLSERMNDVPSRGWTNKHPRDDEAPSPVITLAAEYSTESDHAHKGRLSAYVPSRWLADNLGLRSGPAEFCFSDGNGEIVSWNGAADADSNIDCGMINCSRMTQLLRARNLRLAWWIIGEKLAVDGSFDHKGPCIPFLQGLYWLEGEDVVGWAGVQFDEEYRAGQPRTHQRPFSFTHVWSRPAAQVQVRSRRTK